MAKRPNSRLMALQVENWNLKHPVGSVVAVRKDDGTRHIGETTSEAYIAGGHSAVIHVSGISGYYLLDRVSKCNPEEVPIGFEPDGTP